jgi:hypothetical protein
MSPRKERPPVWQQGASRAYIANPNREQRAPTQLSRRASILVRVLIVAVGAIAFSFMGLSLTGHLGGAWIVVSIAFSYIAPFLFLFERRSSLHGGHLPAHDRARRVVVAVLYLAWLALLVVVLVPGSPIRLGLPELVLLLAIGYALYLAQIAVVRRDAWR